jgi:hypothetical protein
MNGNSMTADKEHNNPNSPYYTGSKECCIDCGEHHEKNIMYIVDGGYICGECYDNRTLEKCLWCNKELPESDEIIYFCSENCETNFKNNN